MKTFIVATCVLCSCASGPKFAPAREDISNAQKKLPGITYEQLVSGFQKYKQTCAACHALYDPKKITRLGWNKILPEMFAKAHVSDSAERRLIENYIDAYAK